MAARKKGAAVATRGAARGTSPAAPRRSAIGPALRGLLLLALSLLTLLALLGWSSGLLNERLAAAARWLVGWGAIPLAALGALAGLLWMLQRPLPRSITVGRALAAELIALATLGLFALVGAPRLAWPSESGGALGWAAALLPSALGKVGGIVLLLLLILLLTPMLLGIPAERLRERVRGWREGLAARKAALESEPPPPATSTRPPRLGRPTPVVRIDGKEQPASALSATAPAPAPTKGKPRSSKATPAAAPSAPPRPATPTAYTLPPLDLLAAGSGATIDPAIAREKARIIEQTLAAFGVPATVVQVNQGPAVTQFGVQPGFIESTRSDGEVLKRKVKVNSITSLQDDLALALAARSIRVEAPVPGRPYIGIEVPNTDTEMVTLRSVLTSDEFKRIKSELRFALGRDVSGRSVAADLARMPHMLIAGATGAGKSVCINTIILSFLLNLGPDRLKLLMIDPKMVELIPYNGIPHLIAPVVTEMERAVGALTWAMREMDRRYKLFSEAGKRNHEGYNTWAAANGHEQLPHIVIIIDELADLMMVAADQVERLIARIAQMSRATGIHLILATQRPSVDVVTGLIKANVPARISFAVASQIDSRVILDTPGAESLLGRGDMLFQAPDSSKLHRLQGCFVSDHEVTEVVRHWLRAGAPAAASAPAPSTAAPAEASEPAPWDEIIEEMAAGADGPMDELLDDAIALVRESKWASTSFLQRKLRVGYTRAARLIDSLESLGIIGPPEEGSNGSRRVLEVEGEEPEP